VVSTAVVQSPVVPTAVVRSTVGLTIIPTKRGFSWNPLTWFQKNAKPNL
jgi:hypothetical protein